MSGDEGRTPKPAVRGDIDIQRVIDDAKASWNHLHKSPPTYWKCGEGDSVVQVEKDGSASAARRVQYVEPGRPGLPDPQKDVVDRPAHYARFKIEPLTFILANNVGFAAGNVIKYVMRHDAKDGLQDLKKARRYLDVMIEAAETEIKLAAL